MMVYSDEWWDDFVRRTMERLAEVKDYRSSPWGSGSGGVMGPGLEKQALLNILSSTTGHLGLTWSFDDDAPEGWRVGGAASLALTDALYRYEAARTLAR